MFADKHAQGRISQVVSSAYANDAINLAYRLQKAFDDVGIPTAIYAEETDKSNSLMKPICELLDTGQSANENDVVIFHASTVCPDLIKKLAESGMRIVVVMHEPIYRELPQDDAEPTISSSYFGLNAQSVRERLNMLSQLSHQAVLACVASTTMQQELLRLGFQHVVVIDCEESREHAIAIDIETALHLSAYAAPTVLSSGVVLPHRQIHLLLQAYHVLTTHLAVGSALIVAGEQPDATYARTLSQQAEELNFARFWMTNIVDDAKRLTFARAANVFVSLSTFGENMRDIALARAAGLPFVLVDTPFSREIANEDDILLPKNCITPELLAEAMLLCCERSGRKPQINSIPDLSVKRLVSYVREVAAS